jgi:hypothetical protein
MYDVTFADGTAVAVEAIDGREAIERAEHENPGKTAQGVTQAPSSLYHLRYQLHDLWF